MVYPISYQVSNCITRMGDLPIPEVLELLLTLIAGLVLAFLGRGLNWKDNQRIQLAFGIAAVLSSVLSLVASNSSAILSVVLLFVGISFLERAWALHRSDVSKR